MAVYSDQILDAVEGSLEMHVGSGLKPQFSIRRTGEEATVRMMNAHIGGDTYLIVAKKVGGSTSSNK